MYKRKKEKTMKTCVWLPIITINIVSLINMYSNTITVFVQFRFVRNSVITVSKRYKKYQVTNVYFQV